MIVDSRRAEILRIQDDPSRNPLIPVYQVVIALLRNRRRFFSNIKIYDVLKSVTFRNLDFCIFKVQKEADSCPYW
jgi:hypothetical protein